MSVSERVRQILEDRSPWEWVGGYTVASWVALQVTETIASIVGLPLWFGRAVLVLVAAGLPVVLLTAVIQGRAPGRGHLRSSTVLARLFCWRNAVLAALVAFTLLGVGTAAHLAARSLGVGPVGTLMARGVLPEDAELVLADLEDHAGDPAAARALTQALRAHLGQSSSVLLASPARVAAALDRMNVEPGAALDLDRAREVAIREGLKAAVGGEIHTIGSRHVVSLSLVAAGSGAELFHGVETVPDAAGLIGAVERLSIRLRERIGESLASVRRSPPLSRVRTASLAALESFTEAAAANGRGDFERCVLLNDEAIALDSLFAMAYVGRAACNQNLGRDVALQIADRVRAYELRDRMTERERLRFTAVYHQFVTRDRERAVQAWETYAAREPGDAPARFALANLYAEGRDWDRAERTLLEGLQLDPSRVIVLLNLSGYQLNMGRYDDAEATLRRLQRAQPGFDPASWRAIVHYARGDWGAAEDELMAALERVRGHPGQRARTATLAALVVATRGRLDQADRLLLEAAAADSAAGEPAGMIARLLTRASLHLEVRGDTAGALVMLNEARARHPWERLDPSERPHLTAAALLAAAGRPAAARREIDAWQRDVASALPRSTVPAWLRAGIAAAEGRHQDALIEWRREDAEREDPVLPLLAMGLAHDRLGRADSAVHYLDRYLTTPSRSRHFSDPEWRGRILERLAQLHEARGEADRAAARYRELVALWRDADPVLQPRVARARDRVSRLDG